MYWLLKIKELYLKMKTVAIDIDGVVMNFTESVKSTYLQCYPDAKVKEVTEWDLKNFYPEEPNIYNFIFNEHVGDVFFTNARLYDDVKQAMDMLKGKVHLVALTSKDYKSSVAMLIWLNWQNLGFNDIHIQLFDSNRLIGKSAVHYDWYIDDSPTNIKELKEAGKRIVIRDQPWNKGIEGIRVYNLIEFAKMVLND
jgi:5'(3')-deoxyribonucleotidase